MRPHRTSWIVVFVIVTVVLGCDSMEFSSNRVVDTDHYRLKRESATVAIVNGVIHVPTTEYSPTAAVKRTITDLLAILGNEALKEPSRSEERRQQIEQVIRQRVNYERMAQHSLGAPWMRLNDTERQEFVSLFVQLLRDRFANKVDQYYDEQIFYLFERRDGNFAEVRTNLVGPKVNTALDFRLEHQSGDWLVYDVMIDYASIVKNYRTQFTQIIRDSSYAGLVEKLKRRALVVKVFEKTAPAHVMARSPTPTSLSR